jgi:hypothetical protein
MAISSVQVVVNGVTTTLTYNSSTGKYEGTITAPSESSGSNNNGSGPGIGANATSGYYPVLVRATDNAGNVTEEDVTGSFTNSLKLKVLETTAPVAAVTYPSNGANIGNNAQPTITFTISDSGSGVKASTVTINLDGTNYAPSTTSFNADGTILSCTFTPSGNLADGSHTIKINADDYDGNSATEVTSTFKIDTTPPTLNITAPTDNLLTNQSSVSVVGSTNDANSTPVTIAISCGGTTYAPTVDASGNFSQSVALTEGSNTITITATDSSGLVTTVTRTVVYDGTAPTITSITITPNPVDAASTYTIVVEVSDS